MLQLVYWSGMGLLLWRYLAAEKTFVNLLFFATACYLVYFVLNVGVHENHLFLGGLLGVLLYGFDSRYAWIAAFVAVSANFSVFLPFNALAYINVLAVVALLVAVALRRLPLTTLDGADARTIRGDSQATLSASS